jgi:ketosteroid isomerase-like protein
VLVLAGLFLVVGLAIPGYTQTVTSKKSSTDKKGGEMNSTQRVVEYHIQRFREGDLEGVLEDFSPEAVVFTPSGTLKGKTEIETLFRNLLEEFGKPAASETVRTAIFEGDYAYLIWSGETGDNNYEFATDTFVVRNGKIVMQSFAAKVTPKR